MRQPKQKVKGKTDFWNNKSTTKPKKSSSFIERPVPFKARKGEKKKTVASKSFNMKKSNPRIQEIKDEDIHKIAMDNLRSRRSRMFKKLRTASKEKLREPLEVDLGKFIFRFYTL